MIDGTERSSRDFLEQLGELDPRQLLDLAQRHLRPQDLVIVVAGPARQLQAPLAKLGLPVIALRAHLSAPMSSPPATVAREEELIRAKGKWAAADESP